MRIFVPHASDLLTDHAAHGDGLVAFEVVSRLAARGHDVHVAAPGISIRGPVPPSLHLHELPMRRGASSRARLAYMLAVRRLYERLRRVRHFDVAHQLNPVFAGISLALAGSGVPIVLGAYVGAWPADADSHAIMGSIRMPFGERLRRAVAWAQQRQAAAIIVTTPAAEGLIVDRAAVAAKLVHIPHGIDPKRFSPLASGAASAVPTILFLGGTERRKGIYTLLDAFRIVRASVPDARLVVGGAGGRLHDVRAAVNAMSEAAHVTLLGNVDRASVPDLIRGASLLCAPSNGEPFGMSLLEAMACGKPVVVTDAGGPQFIVDAAGGEKVPVGDAVALAAALARILGSQETQRAMGAYNRRLVERVYAWDRVIDRVEETYARAIAHAGARA
jgi:glycosyltransferase involved in cell wall biosynthesis